jgi:hypothetical protein
MEVQNHMLVAETRVEEVMALVAQSVSLAAWEEEKEQLPLEQQVVVVHVQEHHNTYRYSRQKRVLVQQ